MHKDVDALSNLQCIEKFTNSCNKSEWRWFLDVFILKKGKRDSNSTFLPRR